MDISAKRLCVLIPCLNEEGAVGQVVERVSEILPEARIVVCDNGSDDRTAEVAKASGAHVIHEPHRGKAHAVATAFRNIDVDLLVMIDGDGSYLPEGITTLLETHQRTRADMVVGVRKASDSDTAFRLGHQAGCKLFAFFLAGAFGLQVRDVFSGLRLFTRRFYRNVPILGRGFELEMELNIQCADKGFRYAEVDVPFRERAGAEPSKLRTFRDGGRILACMLALFRDFLPLRFFSLCAVVFAALSLAAGAPPLLEYWQTGMVGRFPLAILAVGLGILACITFFTGVILESGLRRHREYSQLRMRDFTLDGVASRRPDE